ncbi:MAG: methyl-accepting chemotaxis protein [Granulosicoccus sp.]|nr:methyl-accepting chemotaxis protein [Granulosicoccus sp.]
MARSSDARFPMSLVRDKTFQMRQIRRVLLLTLFFIVQSTLILGVFYHTFLGNLVAGNAPLFFASEDMAALDEAIPDMGSVLGHWLLVMLLINGLVTTGIAVYILRRLGNPILAIRRALNEIGDGNLDVRLRSNDAQEFSELCEALNRALEQVQGKINQARTLTRVLDTLENQPPPDDERVRQAMIECRDVLSYFDGSVEAGNEDLASGDQSGQQQP